MEVRLTKVDGKGMMDDVVPRLREFLDNEARSCSMDFGCITPLYVYRMWGGNASLEDITQGLTELRKQGFIG
jgi:hypothetical protein